MDVVPGPEADDAPADETDADYRRRGGHDHDEDDVEDARHRRRERLSRRERSAAKADSEETAYEQATGTKKD